MKNTIKTALLVICLTALSLVSSHAQTVCKCKLPLDSSYQIAPMTVGPTPGVPPLYQNNNAATPALPLPFDFCFYGHHFDSVHISNNGIISFVQPICRFIDSTQTFPLGDDTLIIAPFYANANTLNLSGTVYYKITPTYMVVLWDSVRYAGIDVDGWNTFQLIISDGSDPIIPDGNNVSYCYPVIQWACSDSSGGFSGYGGTPAFVGINRGDGIHYAQIGRFSLPGNVYDGPFSLLNGVDWLNFQSFTYNSCILGNILPPVICNEMPAAKTLYVCPCDTASTDAARGSHVQSCDTISMGAQFLCAVPGQSAVLSYSVTGALNVSSVYISTANIIDSIVVQAIPAYGDTGIHILTLTATDTVNNVQAVMTYTIDVTMNCQVTPPDSDTVSGIQVLQAIDGFTVYPNPAGKVLTVSYAKGFGNITARIYEISGTEVLDSPISTDRTDIDVSHLARGMYFVELYRDGIPLSVKKIILL